MGPGNAVKLGELLIRSGILTSQQLLESIELAKQTGTPIGRMLVMCGTVSENVLHGSVQIQSLLRENQLDLDGAIALLTMVHKEDITLEQAMQLTGRSVEPRKPTVKLGELLLECGFLLPEELEKFLADSQDAGLPLGRIVLLYGTISKESLSACLTAQVLVRDGKVSREQAIKALQTMRRRRLDLEGSLRELGYYRHPIRPHTLIGELCIKAGLIDEGNVLSALETALEQEIPVGQAMIQKNLVARASLEMALELQEMVVNKTLTEDEAAQVLNKVAQKGFSPTAALTELAIATGTEDDTRGVWQLLTASGTINKDVRQAIFSQTPPPLAELAQKLLQAELIDEFTLHNAFRCQFLMRSGFLALEQAIVVLNHCRSRRIAADIALRELNWIARTKMQLDSAV
jgi:hypothetical protein